MSADVPLPAAPSRPTVKPADWIQLFNGTDLKDWTPKFAKHALGDNFNDTEMLEFLVDQFKANYKRQGK